MPTISIFDGIKISMFYRDHVPPHFHAERGNEEAEVGIDPIMILEGKLARSTRAKVFEWAGDSPSRVTGKLGTGARGSAGHTDRPIGLTGVSVVIIHITQVKIVGPHSLQLAFDNGTRKRVNLRRELYGPIFEPLRDPAFFAKAYLDPDSRTVTWPNGADFAPDFLYQLAPEESPAISIPAS